MALGWFLGALGHLLRVSWGLGGFWEPLGRILGAFGDFFEVLDDLLEIFHQLRQDLERQQGKKMKIELPCRQELDSEGSKATKNRPKIDENVVQKAMLGKQKGKIASSLLKNDEKLLLKGFLEALSAFYRSPWLLSGTLLGRPWPPPALPVKKSRKVETPRCETSFKSV